MGIGLRFGFGPLRVYIPLTKRRRRRGGRSARYWAHPGCTIRHQSEATANRCRNGRTVTPPPSPAPARRPAPAPVSAEVAEARRVMAEVEARNPWLVDPSIPRPSELARQRLAELDARHPWLVDPSIPRPSQRMRDQRGDGSSRPSTS